MQQKGYVLLAILVFMQIYALLGLYGLESTMTTLKMNSRLLQRKQDAQLAKLALNDIANKNFNDKCFISAGNIMQKKSLEWWQQWGCNGNLAGFEYYYVIEALGNDPCALIDQNQLISADYYRITLVSFSKNYSKLILQSIEVKPSNTQNLCMGEMHMVIEGRQHWREL